MSLPGENTERVIPGGEDTTVESLTPPEQTPQVSEIENVVKTLNDSFSKVSAIKDPVTAEYELLKEAKRLDIPVDAYRRMLEAYSQEKEAQKPELEWVKPLKVLDMRLGDFVKWCENVSLYGFATVIGQFTLLAAMGAYFWEAPQRQQQAITEARQEVRNQQQFAYSQARIEALESLNKFCETSSGEQAPNANLEGIKLNQCHKFQLGLATFAQFPPQFFKYEGFDLSHANLAGANLKGANLEGANLEGANLEGANLDRVNLKGANLKKANLKGASLRAAYLEGANLEEANLDGSKMSRVYLRNANLTKVSAIGARLLWSDLLGAKLLLANFQDANLNRANLQGAELYKANFKGASLRSADMREGTIMIGADFERANLKGAKFSSVEQVQRAYNWEKALKDDDWEAKIAKPSEDKYKVGYLIPNQGSIYKYYQQGIEKAVKANKQLEFLPIATGETVELERQGIKQLLAEDVDIIVLRPVDTEKSISAAFEAFDAGVVVITIGDCLSVEGQKAVFACYESNSFQIGYDLGKYMSAWAEKELPGKTFNVGLVDGADSTRVYPYLQGFLAGIPSPQLTWNQTASTNASAVEDLDKVKAILAKHPEINAIWAGAEIPTTLALTAVKELGLEGKVHVFGIAPLNRKLANLLLDPTQALQSIIDESPADMAERAVRRGIGIIERKESREYEYIVYKHRLLTQNDNQAVNQLLAQTLDLEKSDLQPATPVSQENIIPSEVPSSLSPSLAVPLPAITDKATIDKLQEQLQQQLLQNWQTASMAENQTPASLRDNVVYRVLATADGTVAAYEAVDEDALNFAQKTPLPKVLAASKVSDGVDDGSDLLTGPLPETVINQPVAEFKVTFTTNGKVEVVWGESLIDE